MLNSERMTVALENAHLQELAKQSDVTHIQITLKQPGRKPDTWRDVKISISLEDNGTNPPKHQNQCLRCRPNRSPIL